MASSGAESGVRAASPQPQLRPASEIEVHLLRGLCRCLQILTGMEKEEDLELLGSGVTCY